MEESIPAAQVNKRTRRLKMKRLIEALKKLGIEIPEDKQAEVKKTLSEQYKAVEEHNKAVSKLEAERDDWKQKAKTAEETLKGFEGVDLATVQKELADWKKKAEDAEANAKKQMYERDFADTLKTELENIKFTSEAAKRDVMSQITAAELKLKDGKILGLSDLIEQIRKNDASAFVDEHQEQLNNNKAKFTGKMSGSNASTTMTKDQIMTIKDPTERRKAMKENISLFQKEE